MKARKPDSTQESIQFWSGGLRLEGVLSYPGTSGPLDVAVLAPPHPCLGGDMENNVILALVTAFSERGVATLRFNCRGVGRSETHVSLEQQVAAFWENPRIDPDTDPALADFEAATEFALSAVGHCRRLLLAGYSFGGVLALVLAARRTDAAGLAAISPPVHQLVGGLPLPRVARAVITRGGDDLGVDTAAHSCLIQSLGPLAVSLEFPETDHFYCGIEAALAERVVTALLEER